MSDLWKFTTSQSTDVSNHEFWHFNESIESQQFISYNCPSQNSAVLHFVMAQKVRQQLKTNSFYCWLDTVVRTVAWLDLVSRWNWARHGKFSLLQSNLLFWRAHFSKTHNPICSIVCYCLLVIEYWDIELIHNMFLTKTKTSYKDYVKSIKYCYVGGCKKM